MAESDPSEHHSDDCSLDPIRIGMNTGNILDPIELSNVFSMDQPPDEDWKSPSYPLRPNRVAIPMFPANPAFTIDKHSTEKRYTCIVCRKSMSKKTNLASHMRKHVPSAAIP